MTTLISTEMKTQLNTAFSAFFATNNPCMLAWANSRPAKDYGDRGSVNEYWEDYNYLAPPAPPQQITVPENNYITTLLQYCLDLGTLAMINLPTIKNVDQWPGGRSAYFSALNTWETHRNNLRYPIGIPQQIIQLPQDLARASTTTLEAIADLIDFCDSLIASPEDKTTIDMFFQKLDLLSKHSKTTCSSMDSLLKAFKEAPIVFYNASTDLQRLSDNAYKAVGASEALITDFRKQIDELKSQQNSSVIGIVGSTFVIGGGVVFCAVAIVLAPATGGGSLALLLPGAALFAGGSYTMAISAKAIKEGKEQINTLYQSCDDITSSILHLNVFSGQCTSAKKVCERLTNSLEVLQGPWNESAKLFHNTMTKLEDIMKRSGQILTPKDWLLVKDEMTSISKGFNAYNETLNSMSNFNVQVSNLDLKDITDDNIKKAVTSQKFISIVDFIDKYYFAPDRQ